MLKGWLRASAPGCPAGYDGWVASGLLGRVDGWAGKGIEVAIGRRHRRRLKRVGRIEQLEPPPGPSQWAAGDPPPRAGGALEVLVDGGEALPRIAEAMAGARSHVHIAGWHVTPGFGLTRHDQASRLRDQLGELAERVDVRVLLWAGAPVRVFTPGRSAVRRGREDLIRGTRVQCALDSRERPMHCHHEKLVIVDGDVAFIGGIDLTSLGGDRFDTSDHLMHGRLGWHDASSCVRGPAVADVAAHFAARWHAVTGEQVRQTPPPAPAGEVELQVVRTVPEKIYDFLPRGDFRIVEAYTRALRSASKLVYLESQFLWSAQVVEILANKLREPPSDDFRVVVLLPQSRTTARTQRGASSGSWLPLTTAPGAFWRRLSQPAAGDSAARSTSTPRSGSSTTPG